jgi:hypothetical protein
VIVYKGVPYARIGARPYPLLMPIGGGGDLAQKMSVQFLSLAEVPHALMRRVQPEPGLCSQEHHD